MFFFGKSSTSRVSGLLLVGILLTLLTAGCAILGEVNDEAVSGQIKPSPDGLDQLPKYEGYETATPVPTIEPEKDEPQFLVTDVSNYTDKNGDTVFIGRLENTTLDPLDYAVVTVRLLNENGEAVASASEYTLLDVTFPDGVNAFRVAFGSDIQGWVDYLVDVEADPYLGDYLNLDLDFSISSAGNSESGGFQVNGEVFNKSESIAQDVYLLVILYDKQLNVLDVNAVQTDLTIVPVRGDSSFEYLWERGQGVQVGRYEILLQGYR